jgi:hypothetical protein
MASFEELAEEFGGALDLGHLPDEQRSLFSAFQSSMQNMLALSFAGKTQGPVAKITRIGILKSLDVNALAASFDEEDFIGINAGTIMYILNLCDALLSHPDLLKHVGEPISERYDETFDPRRGLTDPDWLRARWRSTQPNDPRRRGYARILGVQALIFVFLHELGHVEHGHVDWVCGATGLRAMVERPSGAGPDLSGLDSQTLEMDADCFAASTMAHAPADQAWTRIVSSLVREPSPFQDASYVWLFASQIFFRAIAADNAVQEPFRLPHPPPQFRQRYISPTGLEVVRKYYPERLNDFVHTSAHAFMEVERAFCALSREPFRMQVVTTGGKTWPVGWHEGLIHLERLLQNWKILRPQLLPLVRRGGLPA